MADFIFRVESIALTDEQKLKIAAAIQGAVLTELAKLDLTSQTTAQKPQEVSGGSNFAFYPHHGWYGGIIVPELAALQRAATSVLTVQESAQAASAKTS